MAKAKFALFLIVVLVSACGTPDHRSIPEKTSAFTKNAHADEGCTYGPIDGTVKRTTRTGSFYEYELSSYDGRTSRREYLQYSQGGTTSAHCAEKPKVVTPTMKPGAKK